MNIVVHYRTGEYKTHCLLDTTNLPDGHMWTNRQFPEDHAAINCAECRKHPDLMTSWDIIEENIEEQFRVDKDPQ